MARAAGCQLERAFEAGEHCTRRHQPDSSGRELDRQRQAVEPRADLGDRRPVACIEGEARLGRPDPLDKELLRRRQRLVGVRIVHLHGERRDGQLALAIEAQRRAAGDHGAQARCRRQQVGDQRRGVEHVLEVVEHEEHLAIGEVVAEDRRVAAAGLLAQGEGAGDGGGDEVGFPRGGQEHREGAIGLIRQQVRRKAHREARLARASGSGEGEQPGPVLGQDRPGGGQLALAADQLGRLGRQIRRARADRAQRGEPAVEPLDLQVPKGEGLVDVLEPVGAERPQGDPDRGLAELLARGARQHHLAAVPGRADPGAPVQVDPHVALGARHGRAGVEADAQAQGGSIGPAVPGVGALDGDRRAKGGNALGEGDEEGVALGVNLVSAVLGDRRAQDAAVIRQGLGVALAERSQEARRALDVGEHEGDRAGGRPHGVYPIRPPAGLSSRGRSARPCARRCARDRRRPSLASATRFRRRPPWVRGWVRARANRSDAPCPGFAARWRGSVRHPGLWGKIAPARAVVWATGAAGPAETKEHDMSEPAPVEVEAHGCKVKLGAVRDRGPHAVQVARRPRDRGPRPPGAELPARRRGPDDRAALHAAGRAGEQPEIELHGKVR